MTHAVLQRQCACGGTPGPDGECTACKAKRLQRGTAAIGPGAAPPLVHDVLRSLGSPLEPSAQADMELSFGHDFSRVRVHADAEAAESARAVGALAYTVGRDVVFAGGRYAPGTREGRRLLAHELAHVVQQDGDHPASSLTLGRADDELEREAHSAGAVALEGGRVTAEARPSNARRLHRQELTLPRLEGDDLDSATAWIRAGVGELPHASRPPGRVRRLASEAPRHQAGVVLRQVSEPSGSIPVDERLSDPGFVICTAFCYLGVPPGFFKDLVQFFLEAVFHEMREADRRGYTRRFETFRNDLAAYSKVRLVARVLRWVVHGEIGIAGLPVRVATARAVATRAAVVRLLRQWGVRQASLVAAEQVVRRLVLVADIAIAGACGAYCGATAIGRTIVEITEAVVQGLADALAAVRQLSAAWGEAFSTFVFEAIARHYGMLDPANWRLAPSLDTRDMSALGMSLWAQIRPGTPWVRRSAAETPLDFFVRQARRPIGELVIPTVRRQWLPTVAAACQRALSAKASRAVITPAMLEGMSPSGFVEFLNENSLLSFREDPTTYATAAMAEAADESPIAGGSESSAVPAKSGASSP